MPTPTGTIALSDVNTELGLPSTTNISLGQADVRTLAQRPRGFVEMSALRGRTKFNPGYSPGSSFNLQSFRLVDDAGAEIAYQSDGQDPSDGRLFRSGTSTNSGPNVWGSPLVSSIGVSFEIRVLITAVNIAPGSDPSSVNTFTVFGTQYTGPATTPWVDLDRRRTILAASKGNFGGTYGSVESYGAIEIRPIAGGQSIFANYYMIAAGRTDG
jgi:hypothetical protein